MQKRNVIVLAVVAIIVVATAVAGRRIALWIPTFAAWVDSLGAAGPVAFIIGYVLAVVLLVPGSVLTLAAGALFGLLRGTVFVFIAATAGATLAFLIARHAARGAVARRFGDNARFRAIDQAIAREGRKIAFLIRLSPLFPFSATNYALGLTSIRLRDYVLACVGMLPGTLLYVYYGRLIGDVAGLVAGAGVQRDTAYWLFLIVGLAATVLVTAVITRAARRALDSSVGEPRQGDTQ